LGRYSDAVVVQDVDAGAMRPAISVTGRMPGAAAWAALTIPHT
jgi:hypothetical protein